MNATEGISRAKIAATALTIAGVSTATLSVELMSTPEGLYGLKAEYDRLGVVTGNTLPFALHEWHLAWCSHYLNIDPRIHDELAIFLLRDHVGACVAILPFVMSRRRFGFLEIVAMDLLGADPSTTESRTPLIASGYEAIAIETVRRCLAAMYDWDWIAWHGATGDFGRALAGSRTVEIQPEAPGYILDLPDSWEQFRTGLKRNIRESLRHCYNSLRRDGHPFEFDVARKPAEVRDALGRFFELHAMRARLTDTVEHFDHFSSQAARSFLIDVCERLAARDAVRIFKLSIGSEVVAMRIGFVVGSSLYLYFSGFDPRWRRYSIMTTTVAEAIKYVISEGVRKVNLTRGSDPSKTRWGPRRVEYTGGFECRSRLKSRLAHRCYMSARSRTGVASWILRRLGKTRRTWSGASTPIQ